eukprot:TRINITY_DN6312_c0_g1_i1.p2 TRINITY_DN6312_c0_g1~~TRINITY_DN6312_c0_g1_i1.p2  ORF type:complete len:250 (-),score=75.99 TRINITY_DN6312_c0_g1_i1:79-828(-)
MQQAAAAQPAKRGRKRKDPNAPQGSTPAPKRQKVGRPPKNKVARDAAEAAAPEAPKQQAGKRRPCGDGGGGVARKKKGSKKNSLKAALPMMMYGFGDAQNPLPETVGLVKSIVKEFITELTVKTTTVCRRTKLRPEDIFFSLRNDRKKCARAKELVRMKKTIQQAKQQADDVPISQAKALESGDEGGLVSPPPSGFGDDAGVDDCTTELQQSAQFFGTGSSRGKGRGAGPAGTALASLGLGGLGLEGLI